MQHGVQITIGSTSALNLILAPGGGATTVNVDASAPTVETESSDVGGTVDAKQIVELPLALGGVGALRSPEAFEFLLPGTTGPGTAKRAAMLQIRLGLSAPAVFANQQPYPCGKLRACADRL